MCPPPKPRKQKGPPAPIEAPEIELGIDVGSGAEVRKRTARGRNQLRTGLNAGTASSGLTIPTS